MPLLLRQVYAVAGTAFAMTGLLLAGIAPVAWLFSVSTSSLPFIVLLNLTAWGVAMGFACRLLLQFGTTAASGRSGGIKWWFAIYVVASLQMATTMRPLLTPSDVWIESGKKSFVMHFLDSMTEPGAARPATGQASK
jgi:hypothetical protein